MIQDGQSPDLATFLREWGVDAGHDHRGGLLPKPDGIHAKREVTLCQRKADRMGASLGKTTGWIHRAALKSAKVKMLPGVTYERMDDQGLWIREGSGEPRCLEVDSVINCSGQTSNLDLLEAARALGVRVSLIGGAKLATELDAQRAIREGAELATRM